MSNNVILFPPRRFPALTVGDLRRIIADLPNEMPISVEVEANEGDDFVVAALRDANIEERRVDIECLYLWGSEDEDRRQGDGERAMGPRR